MIYILIFLYVTLMYLKYILNEFDELKIKPLDILPIGLLIGSFSIFLVHWLSPHNFLGYNNGFLVYFDYAKDRAVIRELWPMREFNYDLLSNYLFTGFTEEISKLGAGFLTFLIYKKTSMTKLFFYVILAASFFAFIENTHYLERYGPQVVLTRSIFSTTTHICLGMILAFFMILSLNQKKMVKTWAYMITGLLIASFLHGSFNLTLYMDLPTVNLIVWITIIVLGMVSLERVKRYLV